MESIKDFVLKVKKHKHGKQILVGMFDPAQYEFIDVYNEIGFLFGQAMYTIQLCSKTDPSNIPEEYSVFIERKNELADCLLELIRSIISKNILYISRRCELYSFP